VPQQFLGVASGGRRRISGRPAARNGEYRNSGQWAATTHTGANFPADRAVWLGMLGRMGKNTKPPLRIFNYIFFRLMDISFFREEPAVPPSTVT